jgi:hypothetical protein
MRAILVMLLCVGCNAAPTKGDAGSNSGVDLDSMDVESTSHDGSTDHPADASSADSGGASDVSNADDGPPPVSTAYREPQTIRGGACADTEAATDACGGDSAEAVYCSLDDPTRVVMAVCLSSSRGSQCQAMDDCGPGWSACTATQYVERGGRDVEPNFSTTNRAWLAACVQDAGGQTLRNEPCSPCTDFDPAYDPAVMWWCEDGSVVYEGGMDGDRLGVVTSPECFRVGQNAPSNGAWWALEFASSGPPFVVCCEDAF